MRAADHARVWERAVAGMRATLLNINEDNQDPFVWAAQSQIHAVMTGMELIADAYREEAERNPE